MLRRTVTTYMEFSRRQPITDNVAGHQEDDIYKLYELLKLLMFASSSLKEADISDLPPDIQSGMGVFRWAGDSLSRFFKRYEICVGGSKIWNDDCDGGIEEEVI